MSYTQLAAYARLSKNPDGSLTSVAEQFAIMDDHAAANGNVITAYFSDDNLSAWNTEVERAGWGLYLKALDTGQHDGAMSYHFDRLSRNGRDSEALLSVTTRRDLPLITPEQVLDLGSNSDARFVFRIQAAMAIQQSDATSRRVRDKKELKRRQGNLRYVLGGTPPVGFRDGDTDWETDPEHAAVLLAVAERVIAGEALSAAFADQPAIFTNPTRGRPDSGGRPVNEKMIRAALKRPSTAGLMTSRDGEIMGAAAITDPPLDPATWRQLGAIFASRERGKVSSGKYPLGKLLACGVCGNQMTGEPVAGQPSYRCKNPHRQPDGSYNTPCRGVSIQVTQIHDLIRAAVEARVQTSPVLAAASGDRAAFGARQTELEAQLAKAQDWLADLSDKRLAGYITAARFAVAEAEHIGQIDSLRAELAQVATVASAPAIPADIDWDGMTGAELRNLVGVVLVTPIKVRPGRGGGRPMPASERVSLVAREG